LDFLKIPTLGEVGKILEKRVEQIVKMAGDGRLVDGGETSKEFREFLGNVPDSTFLGRYVNECLQEPFESSGLVLQDLINEVGKRLGFKVEHGRYAGTKKELGWDGIWKTKDKTFIIEVKTTDAYALRLTQINKFKIEIIDKQGLDSKNTFILIVTGRNETGSIEEQIRGSKNAWDTRLISCSSLLNLLQVKETISGVHQTLERIQQILQPLEYTRLDNIVAMLFNTTEDIKAFDVASSKDDEESSGSKKALKPVSYHDECLKRLSDHFKRQLIKQGRCFFASSDDKIKVVCAVSKEYGNSQDGKTGYWFAFHPNQKEFLANAKEGYVAFGCGSEKHIVLFGRDEFLKNIPFLNQTKREDRHYWHVIIEKRNDKWTLNRAKESGRLDITKNLLA
jgi:hypothetical protein